MNINSGSGHTHPLDNIARKAYLPYIQGVIDKIARVLRKNNIITSFKPLVTLRHNMDSITDTIDIH